MRIHRNSFVTSVPPWGPSGTEGHAVLAGRGSGIRALREALAVPQIPVPLSRHRGLHRVRFWMTGVLLTTLWGWAGGQTPVLPGEVRPGGLQWECFAGPTGFTGANNREDGYRVGSAGAWQTALQINYFPAKRWGLGFQRNVGELALNSAEFQLLRQAHRSDALLVRFQPVEHASRRLQPWFSIGWARVSQTLLQEQRLADGTEVHRWSNGLTYDRPEDAPLAVFEAQEVTPDYNFESRTPATTSWALPVEVGAHLFLGRRLMATGRMGVLSGLETRLDPRAERPDWLVYASLGLGVRLGAHYRQPRIQYPAAYLALGTDADRDGVKDADDRCPGTPASATVDRKGCPVDRDGDGIPDYRDAEPLSPHTQVNAQGVALDDATWGREWSQWGTASPLPARQDHRIIHASDTTQRTVPQPRPTESTPTPAEQRLRQQLLSGLPIEALGTPGFRVQLPQNAMLIKPDVLSIWIDEGKFFAEKNSFEKTEFVSSRYRNESDARFFLQQVRLAGFPSAFVVGDIDGQWADLGDVRSLVRALELGTDTATFTQ